MNLIKTKSSHGCSRRGARRLPAKKTVDKVAAILSLPLHTCVYLIMWVFAT